MLACSRCPETYLDDARHWCCTCGGPLYYRGEVAFDRGAITGGPPTLWRYRAALPPLPRGQEISLGEGFTPLVTARWRGHEIHFKLDFLCPTGSFKDRGSTVMMSQVARFGVGRVLEDSSGNGGASVAAYAARAGVACDIYVPEGTSPGKTAQIEMYGAGLKIIPGSREDCAAAARAAAETTYYASHNWNPYFLEGTKTVAFELWEQLGWRAPANVVTPIGNGSLVLGAYLGFSQLKQAGVIETLPRIFGAQTESCAPFVQAQDQGLDHCPAVEKQPTIAEGITIATPTRDRETLAGVRESGGGFAASSDAEIWQAVRELAALGIYCEPTSGAAPAALDKLMAQGMLADGPTAVVLSGFGLKATAKVVELLAGEAP